MINVIHLLSVCFQKVEIVEIVEPKTTTPAPLQDCRDLPTGNHRFSNSIRLTIASS